MRRQRSTFQRALGVLSTCLLVGSIVPAVSAAEPQRETQRLQAFPERLRVSRVPSDSPDKSRPDARGGLVSVIIKLDLEPLASYDGGVPTLAPTQGIVAARRADAAARSTISRYESYAAGVLGDFEGRLKDAIPSARILHRYVWAYGGIAAAVPTDRLAEIRKMGGVMGVQHDRILKLDTTVSPQFIDAPSTWSRLGGAKDAGEGVIVGVLDTGVWPEHPSYSDPDPTGEAYDSPPAAPDGDRECEFSGGDNPGDPFTCNDKLIGADRFMEAYDFFVGLAPGEFTTARDDDGHGTHTSTTAAGNRRVASQVFGVSRGRVSGIAPRAHVIGYKVCGEQGCFSSDSAAAVDEAIQDGVNVINFSISGGEDPYTDPVSLAFLDAYAAGIFVAASAGNSGPGADTVAHREPWVTTVGASTSDRHFVTDVTVSSSTAADTSFDGASITDGVPPTDLVNAADMPYDDPTCEDTTVDLAFEGKVVICERGGNGRAEKGYNVFQRGAAGMILYNQAPEVTDLETDNHWLPTAHIQYDDGQALLAYYADDADAEASWGAGIPTTVQGDVMASFSSRGGPGQLLGVSKPDVTAPGVQILAGHSPEHVAVAGGPNGELFQAIAGTSMSSPHVAGAAALLTDLKPSWHPGQIKSALMTTAFQGVFKEDSVTRTDPFDDGSGRVDLARAHSPGITFSSLAPTYFLHEADLYDTNYPSIYVPNMPGIVTVNRRARSELPGPRRWTITTKSMADFEIRTPDAIAVGAGGSATFNITLDASTVPLGEVRHGVIILRSGGYKARMPVTIARGVGAVSVDKECEPERLPRGSTTSCVIDITNDTFEDAAVTLTDRLPSQLKIKADSISGATLAGNGVFLNTLLDAGEPPNVMVDPGTFDGYIPLAGTEPLVLDLGDEDAVNLSGFGSFSFQGISWTDIGVVSNGYAVVGGASGEDISFVNFSPLPDTSPPNNVLSPYWTDLNPEEGGAIYANILCQTMVGPCWLVIEWNQIPEFSDPDVTSHTFQIWLGLDDDGTTEEDITFEYDAQQGSGDSGALTVGAENLFGNRGETVFFDGGPAADEPADGDQWRVTSTAGEPGETVAVEFDARARRVGRWTNCAVVRASTFDGRAVDCVEGRVRAP